HARAQDVLRREADAALQQRECLGSPLIVRQIRDILPQHPLERGPGRRHFGPAMLASQRRGDPRERRQVRQFHARAKSMKPRNGSARTSLRATRSPTSIPCAPFTTLPSAGGCSSRAYVPSLFTPVTIASKRWPILSLSSCAAITLRICRSTFC